jgi:hypothetical protein
MRDDGANLITKEAQSRYFMVSSEMRKTGRDTRVISMKQDCELRYRWQKEN